MINSAPSISLCSEAFISRIIPLGVEQQARGVAHLEKTPVSLEKRLSTFNTKRLTSQSSEFILQRDPLVQRYLGSCCKAFGLRSVTHVVRRGHLGPSICL